MVSDNMYLKFEPVSSYEDTLNFIEDKIEYHSSMENYFEKMKLILDYKNRHSRNYKEDIQRRNIYSYRIDIMIPYEIKPDRWNEFTENFMDKIGAKDLLYIYYFDKQGDGQYVKILAFTRKIKEIAEPKKYVRDYYYDNKGKLCNKNNPNAILKHKAGDIVKDKEGNIVYEYFEAREEDIFRFSNFYGFIKRLKNTIFEVATSMIGDFKKIILSRITSNETQSKSVIIAIIKRNQYITSINDMLMDVHKKLLKKYNDDSENINLEKFRMFVENLDTFVSTKPSTYEIVKNMISEW
ncbi:MAG: hypothetical protein LUF02_01135 [Erysipelotrichaceae bacterium]|nr:hypothetical protein [Erysipelotrichaceae bacterium]